jgi:hypothetical protein
VGGRCWRLEGNNDDDGGCSLEAAGVGAERSRKGRRQQCTGRQASPSCPDLNDAYIRQRRCGFAIGSYRLARMAPRRPVEGKWAEGRATAMTPASWDSAALLTAETTPAEQPLL